MLPLLALALTTGAAPVFVNQTPTNPPTLRRSSGSAVKSDGGSDALFVFGGFNGGTTLADLPRYSAGTNGWSTPVLAPAIPGRERHSLAYDPVHDLLVIVGGVNGVTIFDTVFVIGPTFNVSTPALPATRPSARMDAALHWAPSLGKFVYFGGNGSIFGNNHFNDLWTLEVADGGVTWQAIVPTGTGPSARGAVCSAWNPTDNTLLMFGGETNGPNSAEVWKFNFGANAWTSPATTGTGPSARSFCSGDWEPNVNQLVVYGGQTTAPTGGLFSFDPATNVWTAHSPAINPGPLSDSSASYSPQLNGIVFFGGRIASTTYTNNTWLLRFNRPPVVDAGPDQSVGENVSVSLSGGGTDPDGDPLTWLWAQSQGPTVTLSNPTQLTPTFNAPAVTAQATLRFVLTGSDAVSSASDEVVVTVNNTINEPPVADAGPDFIVDGGTLVTLVGSGLDPNGTALTYGWSQVMGPGVTLSSLTSATTTFVAPALAAATPLAFTLTVNDGTAVGQDEVVVTVRETPIVDAGVVDAGVDAGVVDAGVVDAGVVDAGVVDAGVVDAGAVDAGAVDA
ncbi:MAG: Peptidase, (Fungalysin) family, partial [Myxococcaceae bacterium]|nr:Peptidase, (Fungalysin) family [Myxococcaceae bacterium]